MNKKSYKGGEKMNMNTKLRGMDLALKMLEDLLKNSNSLRYVEIIKREKNNTYNIMIFVGIQEENKKYERVFNFKEVKEDVKNKIVELESNLYDALINVIGKKFKEYFNVETGFYVDWFNDMRDFYISDLKNNKKYIINNVVLCKRFETDNEKVEKKFLSFRFERKDFKEIE